MKRNHIALSLVTLVFSASMSSALEVDVDRVDDTGLPWGYTDVSDFGVDEDAGRLARQNSLIWDHARSLQLSDAPFVDYMVAFNGGIAGIMAEKDGGPYLEASQSTVFALTGGSNGGIVPDPQDRSTQDRYSSGEMPVGDEKFAAFASWTDGYPTPALNSWWGVSWGGGILFGDNTDTAEIEVRVNLASDGPVNVAHLFNDGWYYSSDLGGSYDPPGWQDTPHPTLDGHEFTVTHHAADGTVLDEVALVLPSGGGTNVLGVANDYASQFGVLPSGINMRGDKYYLINNHRQFYTATITATRQAEGDYLILKNTGGNIGYRMTLVTLGNDRPWDEGGPFALTPGEYVYDDYLSWTYGATPEMGQSQMLGWVYVPLHPDAIYAYKLGWLLAPTGLASTGLYFYRFDTANWIWTNENYGGFYWDYASSSWGSAL